MIQAQFFLFLLLLLLVGALLFLLLLFINEVECQQRLSLITLILSVTAVFNYVYFTPFLYQKAFQVHTPENKTFEHDAIQDLPKQKPLARYIWFPPHSIQLVADPKHSLQLDEQAANEVKMK